MANREGGSHEPEEASGSWNLMNIERFRERPVAFLGEIVKFLGGSNWRGYDDYIGQPLYYPSFPDEMKARLMRSNLLLDKIDELAVREVNRESWLHGDPRQQRLQQLRQWMLDVIENQAENVICQFRSKATLKTMNYLASQLMGRTYHQGVFVDEQEIVRLRETAKMCRDTNQSLIFLPSHRSHIDYVAIQVISLRIGLSLPAVVAGENLNFTLLGPLLHQVGAMWIRRSFADDQLYSALIQAYVDTLLQNGYNFECFVEGTRSRSGKLLTPKYGILKFILDSILSGRVKDAQIVPVSTQYDKVIEGRSYMRELLGKEKKKENLWDFLNASSVLSLKMGRIEVRFHEAWSLKDFLIDQLQKFHNPVSNLPPNEPINDDVKRKLLRAVGYKVLSDINDASVVMPTGLVGTVLLTLRGPGIGRAALIARVERLCRKVSENGGRVVDFGNSSTEEVLDRALDVLGNLVGCEKKEILEPTYYAADRFLLSFYRNMVIHLFVAESIVAASMYAQIKRGGASSKTPIDVLYAQASFLSSTLADEFVYRVEGMESNLLNTLHHLESLDIVTIDEETNTVEISRNEVNSGRENFDFYCFLVWPFIDGFWLASVALFGLTPTTQEAENINSSSGKCKTISVSLKEFERLSQEFGKTLFSQGDLSYYESVSREVMLNALRRFESEGIVSMWMPATGSEKAGLRLCLMPEYLPTRGTSGLIRSKGYPDTSYPVSDIQRVGPLWEVVQKLALSRREGKSRRDSPSVGDRVFYHVDQMASKLQSRNVIALSDLAGLVDSKKLRAAQENARSHL